MPPAVNDQDTAIAGHPDGPFCGRASEQSGGEDLGLDREPILVVDHVLERDDLVALKNRRPQPRCRIEGDDHAQAVGWPPASEIAQSLEAP